MPKTAYSPNTGELIVTDKPGDWMGLTDLVPPSFDRATQGCFFRDGAWEIVDALPMIDPAPTPAEIAQQQIDAIEQKTLMNRAVREGMLATAEFIAATKGVTPDLLYIQNDAYKAVKDVDTVISQLRKKLK